MDLSSEDALRINVLLAGAIEVIRIDESSMTVFALSNNKEAKVKLNPNCRDESYLKRVREVLSSHVLGSPGGYPVYLKRWTRMGQARDETLESLLLLGEPEAVVAVVNATGITDELARRAWWAVQSADNARCMLRQEAVVNGSMGPMLAEFLVEFLPFEEEAGKMIESVMLVLQGELVSDEVRQKLWDKGHLKNAYYVGFLHALPDNLPGEGVAHPSWETAKQQLKELVAGENQLAGKLCRVLGINGTRFLNAAEQVLEKPANQDVVVELMEAIGNYFRLDGEGFSHEKSLTDIISSAEKFIAGATEDASLKKEYLEIMGRSPGVPQLEEKLKAILILSRLGESVVDPVFSRTDAIGTVMRRKLEPVSRPLLEHFSILRN